MRPHPVFRVAPFPKETTPIEIFLEDCDTNDVKDTDEPRGGFEVAQVTRLKRHRTKRGWNPSKEVHVVR